MKDGLLKNGPQLEYKNAKQPNVWTQAGKRGLRGEQADVMVQKRGKDLDVISLGELLVEIIAAKKGQPLSKVGQFTGPYPSGAPAIFIDTIAQLGATAGFIGTVGNDDFGKCILDRLKKDGVDLTYVRVSNNLSTGTAFNVYEPDGNRTFIFHLRDSASGQISTPQIDEKYISSAKWLHVMGSSLCINKKWNEAIKNAIKIAKRSNINLSFDPNIRRELLPLEEIRKICEPVLRGCDLLLPNSIEVEMLTGVKDINKACHALINRGIKTIVLKQEKQGCTIFTRKKKIKIGRFEVREVDPTGAGDCFDAAFVFALLRRWSLKRAGVFANAVGALSVTRQGPMSLDVERVKVLKHHE